MGSVIITEFEDIDSCIEPNDSYLYYEVDFGEGGSQDVAVCTDFISESDCLTSSTSSVTVGIDHIAETVTDEGEIESLLAALCKNTSFDEVFDVFVTLAPDYEDE